MAVEIIPDQVLLSEREVVEFEEAIGFGLPASYRSFLMEFNGGEFPKPSLVQDKYWDLGFYAHPAPPLEEMEAFISPDNFWDLAIMHGLKRGPERYGDLLDIYNTMRNWNHPAELLPIASQLGNAKYFLCLSGPKVGTILLAGRQYVEKYNDDETITPHDYHLLLPSFESLLERLEWRAS